MPKVERPAEESDESSPRTHWFEGAADHLGPAYLRYSFTMGTDQEVGFLVDALDLAPGARILDVGCGPGRHALALAARGFDVTGVDISQRFVDLARDAAKAAGLGAVFARRDARELDYDAEFDAVISLCQGGFGLQGPTGSDTPSPWSAVDGDAAVLGGIARALRPGGRAAVSAFSSYFQVRFLEASDDFDAASSVNHESTELRDAEGHMIEHDLWTTCFTPRELALLADRVGLAVEEIHSVEPGAYAPNPPVITSPEFLLIAERPARAVPKHPEGRIGRAV